MKRAPQLAVMSILALSALPVAQGQCQYTVKSWAPWPCSGGLPMYSVITGLNNLEAWCGYRPKCHGATGDIPVYCPPGGSPQELPLPPGAGPKGAQAVAVNDFGVVVGFSFQGTSGTVKIGCIWKPDGTVTTIAPFPDGVISPPYAVNKQGTVVGTSAGKPYVWSNGEMTLIPTPVEFPGGYATDISDSGFVVGEYGHHSNGSLRGFRWRDGEFEVLEPAESYTVCRARGVNDAGVAVGSSNAYVIGVWVGSVATVWTKDEVIALPSLPGHPFSYAMSINSSGVIIGAASLTGYVDTQVAVVWINGEPHKLTDLMAPGTPSIGNAPHRINEVGEILPYGSNRILTPLSPLAADITGDCAVDGKDIAKVLADWGVTPWSAADLDNDGVVGGRDLALILGEWTGSR
ncbi:MAG: hypothetical protein KF724_00275 [Phycisphaeraceae bacterium]|nr:hypothetical protein [Phycisphaeraceae bacterium]